MTMSTSVVCLHKITKLSIKYLVAYCDFSSAFDFFLQFLTHTIMLMSTNKIQQDKQITAVITTPIIRYSPIFKSDSDESTGKRMSTSLKHLSIVNLKKKFIFYYKMNYICIKLYC